MSAAEDDGTRGVRLLQSAGDVHRLAHGRRHGGNAHRVGAAGPAHHLIGGEAEGIGVDDINRVSSPLQHRRQQRQPHGRLRVAVAARRIDQSNLQHGVLNQLPHTCPVII